MCGGLGPLCDPQGQEYQLPGAVSAPLDATTKRLGDLTRSNGPKERSKSDGITFIVYFIHRRREQEPLARHRSTFRLSPTAREGAVELPGVRPKQRYAARRRAPTLWRSRPPSQLLSMSACMSHACSCLAVEIVRHLADGRAMPMALRPSLWLATRSCNASATTSSDWHDLAWATSRCERLFH